MDRKLKSSVDAILSIRVSGNQHFWFEDIFQIKLTWSAVDVDFCLGIFYQIDGEQLLCQDEAWTNVLKGKGKEAF